MDIQEAIEHCKEVSRKNRKNNVRNTIVIPNHWISSAHCAEEHEQIAEWLEELKQYKQLGTLDEVREAVEKQKRKKPCASNRCYVCPHCGLVASLKIKHNYCDACGQHIDWTEVE